MGTFLRFIIIGLIGYFIIRTIGGLLGLNNSKSKDFPEDKTEIKKNPSEQDRDYKGGDYIDYEEIE